MLLSCDSTPYPVVARPDTLDHAQSRYPIWRDAVRDMVGNMVRSQPDTVNKMAHGKQNGTGSKVTFGLEPPPPDLTTGI